MDIQELTIGRFHDALRTGQTTCEAITAAYLQRISTYDPILNAIICVNENALAIARQKDIETTELLGKSEKFPALHGVPIILKDTYGTRDMPTTVGSRALEGLRTKDDAFVVKKLRAAGAIILAKANPHELSMQGITVSSMKGQTRNPYDLARTPGGSSGGTAAALAANLGLAGCGGDTMNSLRSPASACSVVGFRPTVGQVSRSGTVGVAPTQDAIGPMARTVKDVRVLFEVMMLSAPPAEDGDRSTMQNRRYRVGILDTYFGQENDDVYDDNDNPDETRKETCTVNKTILDALERAHEDGLVDLVHVSLPDDCEVSSLLESADVQSYELRETMDSFLQSDFVQYTPHMTLESISQDEKFLRAAMPAAFFNTLQSDTFNTSSPEYRKRLDRIAKLKQTLHEDCFSKYELDALAYPHQRIFVKKIGPMDNQPGRNGILAALTGRPAVCIPGGYSPASDSMPSTTAPLGVPIGLEFLGQPWRDSELLDLAERFEEVLQARRDPEDILRVAAAGAGGSSAV